MAGSLVLPTSAIAASAPEPPPNNEVASAAGEVKLIDLGSLNGHDDGVYSSLGYIVNARGINNMSQVVASATVSHLNISKRAVLFSGGSATQLHDSLKDLGDGEIISSHAQDINDDGTVVGTFSDMGPDGEKSFVFKDGKATLIEQRFARAINNKGQIGGGGWVRDPDGSVLQLRAFKDQNMGVTGLNDSGSVTGNADVDPDRSVFKVRAFRTKPGKPLDLAKDLLPSAGEAKAADINAKGQVAGYEKGSGGFNVPIIWDADGTAREPETPHGGEAYAINNAGIAVGLMRTSSGPTKAAMYSGRAGTDLNTLVPAGTNLRLTRALGINDLGQISGVATNTTTGAGHAFLLDLGLAKPVINSVTLETKRYPSTEWGEAGAVTDGDPARITVSVTNPGSMPVSAQIKLYQAPNPGEAVDYTPLPKVEPIEVELEPNQTVNVRANWDTAGVAWERGEANLVRYVKARLYMGGVRQGFAESAKITTRPKPVVLVHGWKSNAEIAWGYTHAILDSLHPYIGSFAVGDGEFGPDGGTLDTGDLSDSSKQTNTLAENAKELAKYLENVRTRTGASHVDVIAHSMGGLITRQYIQTEMPSSPDHKPVVNRMLQMGTPNRGTPCADMVVLNATLTNSSVPFSPATEQNTTRFVRGVFNEQYTNLKGVTPSNLAGVGRPLPCVAPPEHTEFYDSDLIVPLWSARFYPDVPRTGTVHMSMTDSAWDFETYVKPRLASVPGKDGDPDLSRLTKGVTGDSAVDAAPAATATDDGGTDAGSVFAASSTAVEAGKTVSVPLDVPHGSAFGVTGSLPSTVGLVLRNPSGEPAAQYAAGSDEAKQPVQGLSVAKPQAGAWKLEITNSATEPVTANLGAWVAGNPVKVAATVEQPSEDGRVKVTGTVTDDGKPVTAVPVQAIVIGEDGARVELSLKDDGNSGDGGAGDGVYGATSESLADGVYSVTVKADTAKGLRAALDVVEVKKPDLREFELTLSAQPGGSVAASPAQDTYRAGTKVTLTPTAEAGRMPLGWIVDGEERPAGKLTLTMDGPHTVLARFGSYTVTELGGAAGEAASATQAVAINDRGQVAATVVSSYDRKHRAVRWQAGEFTDLGGLPCTESANRRCNAGATGINEAGDVSGYALTSVGEEQAPRAVLFDRDGAVTDLQQSGSGWAADVNDNGQVAGVKDGKWVTWDGGTAVAFPAAPQFHSHNAAHHPGGSGAALPRINAHGAVAGAYVADTDYWGNPLYLGPAVYQDGVTTELASPTAECSTNYGDAYDINTAGVAVGALQCRANTDPDHAYVWRDGQATDLGEGTASAINDHGLVVGRALDPEVSTPFHRVLEPVVWLEGTKYPLADLLPRPLCPEKEADTTGPCMGLRWLSDVNSSGQIVAQGFIRDRSTAANSAEFVTSGRSFLLSPTKARADLAVTTEVSASEPGPTSRVTWTATVTNTGDDPATEVRLDVFLPQAVTGAACDTGRGICTAIKGGFRNTVKVLEPGWSATVEVSATVPANTADGTELKARAHGYSLAVSDPKPNNNGASVTSTVRPLLDKTGVNWPDPVEAGQVSHTASVTLTNRLNDPIPLKVIAVSGPFTQTGTCPVELAVGDKCTVQVRFAPTAEGPATGALTFTTADGAAPAYTVPLTGKGIKAGGIPVVQVPAAPLRGQVGKPFTLRVDFTDTDAGDTHTAKVVWGDGPPVDAVVTPRPGGGTVTLTRTFTAPKSGTAMVMVYDSSNNLGYAGVPYVISEAAPNTAPVVTAGADVELTAGEDLQRTVTFADPDSTSWTATVDYGDGSGPQPVTPNAAKQITLEHQWVTPGTYPVTVKVKDDGDLETTATFIATVVAAETPNQAPTVTVSPAFDTVEAGAVWVAPASFTDSDSTSWTYMVDYGAGAGPQPLSKVAGQLKLEHVYASAGDYTVVLTVTDDKGASGSAQVTVHVTNAAPEVALTAPAVAKQPAKVAKVGEAVSLSASFTDSGKADTHTATWSIGSKPVPAAVAGHGGKGTVSGSHVFTKAGLYPISVTVTDNHSGATKADTADGKQAYVVVYDPASSLVGAGQTVSPAGVCKLDAACAKEGEANLNVTAHYRDKDTTPTGELHYNAPGFDLRDDSSTVLAVAGGTAILRGEGKVNKTVDVTYEITTIDSGKPADNTDQLVVRVWKKNGELIYDNSGKPAPVSGVIRVSG
ncbi:PKD domain-containing protein [Streptosporangium canum]|uniref:PKD domain-containing protein n=1 Tax=Streptosporangium canum TaxID=324952 RepID=UPI00342D67A5